jgi:hypothetical protein
MVQGRSTTCMTTLGAMDHILSSILIYPDEHPVGLAVEYLGIDDINSQQKFRGDYSSLPHYIPDTDNHDKFV